MKNLFMFFCALLYSLSTIAQDPSVSTNLNFSETIIVCGEAEIATMTIENDEGVPITSLEITQQYPVGVEIENLVLPDGVLLDEMFLPSGEMINDTTVEFTFNLTIEDLSVLDNIEDSIELSWSVLSNGGFIETFFECADSGDGVTSSFESTVTTTVVVNNDFLVIDEEPTTFNVESPRLFIEDTGTRVLNDMEVFETTTTNLFIIQDIIERSFRIRNPNSPSVNQLSIAVRLEEEFGEVDPSDTNRGFTIVGNTGAPLAMIPITGTLPNYTINLDSSHFQILLGKNSIEQDDVLTLTHTIIVNSCSSEETPPPIAETSDYSLNWNCGAIDEVAECYYTGTGGSETISASKSRVVFSGRDFNIGNFCLDEEERQGEYNISITNSLEPNQGALAEGSNMMRDVAFRLQYRGPLLFEVSDDDVSLVDNTGQVINLNTISPDIVTINTSDPRFIITYVNFADQFPTTGVDPDGPGGLDDLDEDGFYDDLPDGESLELNVLYNNLECPSVVMNPNTLNNFLFLGRIFFRVFYRDMCGNNFVNGNTSEMNDLVEELFFNPSLDTPFNGSILGGFSNTPRYASDRRFNCNLDLDDSLDPNDEIPVGEPFTMTASYQMGYRASSSPSGLFQGNTSYTNCSLDKLEARLRVPPNTALESANPDGSGTIDITINPETVNEEVFTVNVTPGVDIEGNFFEIDINDLYPSTNGISGYFRSIPESIFDIELVFTDCPLTGGNQGLTEFFLELSRICTEDCGCPENLGASRGTVRAICPSPGPCEQLTTTNFTLERTTLGWPEENGEEFYTIEERDAAGMITPDPNIHSLQTASSGDIVHIEVSGGIGTTVTGQTEIYTVEDGGGDLQEYYVELRYDSAPNITASFFDATPGVTQASLLIEYPGITNETYIVPQDDIEFINIPDENAEFHNIIRFYLRGDGLDLVQPNMNVTLMADLRVRFGVGRSFDQFRAEHFGVFENNPIQGQEVIGSCLHRGTSFTVKNISRLSLTSNPRDLGFDSFCEEEGVSFQFISTRFTANVYPNEYRNFFHLNDTVRLQVPKGIRLNNLGYRVIDRFEENANELIINFPLDAVGEVAQTIVGTKTIEEAPFPSTTGSFMLDTSPSDHNLLTIVRDWETGDVDVVGNSEREGPDFFLTYDLICGNEAESLQFNFSAQTVLFSYLEDDTLHQIVNQDESIELAVLRPDLNLSSSDLGSGQGPTFLTGDATWNIMLSNNVSEEAPYTWIHIEAEENINFTAADIAELLSAEDFDAAFNPMSNDGSPILNELFIELTDSFNGNFLKDFALFGTVATCEQSQDSQLTVTTGWNCDAFPNPNELDENCSEQQILVIPYNIEDSGLSTIFNTPEQIEFCDTFEYSIELRGEDLGVVNNILGGFILPNGLLLESASYDLVATGNTVTSSGVLLIDDLSTMEFNDEGQITLFQGWNLSELVLGGADEGLNTNLSDDIANTIIVTLTFISDCAFAESSEREISFFSVGTRSCGELDLEQTTDSISINFSEDQLSGLVDGEIGVETLANCSDINTVTISLTNTGNSPSDGTEQININGIPDGIGVTNTNGINIPITDGSISLLVEEGLQFGQTTTFELIFTGDPLEIGDCLLLGLIAQLQNSNSLTCDMGEITQQCEPITLNEEFPFEIVLSNIEAGFTFPDPCLDIQDVVSFVADNSSVDNTHVWIVTNDVGETIVEDGTSGSTFDFQFLVAGTYTITHTITNDECDCQATTEEGVVIEFSCDMNPCDDSLTNITFTEVEIEGESSCFNLTLLNDFDPNFFTHIEIVGMTMNDGEVLEVELNGLDNSSGFMVTALPDPIAGTGVILEHNSGSIPTGTFVDFTTICLGEFNVSPQLIKIHWYTENPVVSEGEIAPEPICTDEIETDFEVELECLEITNGEVICEDGGQLIYTFDVMNLTTDETLEYLVLLIEDNQVTIDIPPVAPGETLEGVTAIIPNIYEFGEEVCFRVNAHNSDVHDDISFCCQSNVDYCFVVPICCDDIEVDIDIDNFECCFTIDYNNTTGVDFTAIQVEITTPGVNFSSFEPNTPWDLEFVGANNYIFTYNGNTNIPLETTLPELCLDSEDTNEQDIQVSFLVEDEVVCTEDIQMFCNSDCIIFADEEVTCTGEGDFQYTFDFYNNSGLEIDEFEFTMSTPEGLVVTPDVIEGPFAINEFHEVTVILSGIGNPDQLCFRLRAFNSNEVCCFTEERCINLPVCCEPEITGPTELCKGEVGELLFKSCCTIDSIRILGVNGFSAFSRDSSNVNASEFEFTDIPAGFYTIEAICSDGSIEEVEYNISEIQAPVCNIEIEEGEFIAEPNFIENETGVTKIYIGYGPQTANLSGPDGNFEYAWSTGETSQSIIFNPLEDGILEGLQEIELAITDNDTGCVSTCQVAFCLEDIRCSRGRVLFCRVLNSGFSRNGCLKPEGVFNRLNNPNFNIQLGSCNSNNDCVPTTGIESNVIEEGFVLTNSPNPSSTSTTILFNIPDSQNTILNIFNVRGQKIEGLYDDYAEGGKNYTFNIESSRFAPGVYLIKLITESGEIRVHKMIVSDF